MENNAICFSICTFYNLYCQNVYLLKKYFKQISKFKVTQQNILTNFDIIFFLNIKSL